MYPTGDVEMAANAFDDDDGMPPLVDTLPLAPMTFTFATDVPRIGFRDDVMNYEQLADPVASDMPPGVEAPTHSPPRVSHAKKRDASHIPRPPNAFILFRSSFIKAQHIPGKIEGNHSSLSKIIGKCWKALPRDERKVWEAQAIAALAEHRKKYPDWRFKPAADALAKVKDGPRKRSHRKGRGESEEEERTREKRCATIADLLVAGKTGTELATAMKEYDGDGERGRQSHSVATPAIRKGHRRAVNHTRTATTPTISGNPGTSGSSHALGTPGETDPLAADARFNVSLTAMFKRSSSAPAPYVRGDPGQFHRASQSPVPLRRDSFSAVPSAIFGMQHAFSTHDACGAHEENTRSEFKTESLGDMASAVPDSVSSTQTFVPGLAEQLFPLRTDGLNCNVHDNDQMYAFGCTDFACSSPVPAFEADVEGTNTPGQSPVTTPSTHRLASDSDFGSPRSISDLMGEPFVASPSTYSSLDGWAGHTSYTFPAYAPLPAAFGLTPGDAFLSGLEEVFAAPDLGAFGLGKGSHPVMDIPNHTEALWNMTAYDAVIYPATQTGLGRPGTFQSFDSPAAVLKSQ